MVWWRGGVVATLPVGLDRVEKRFDDLVDREPGIDLEDPRPGAEHRAEQLERLMYEFWCSGVGDGARRMLLVRPRCSGQETIAGRVGVSGQHDLDETRIAFVSNLLEALDERQTTEILGDDHVALGREMGLDEPDRQFSSQQLGVVVGLPTGELHPQLIDLDDERGLVIERPARRDGRLADAGRAVEMNEPWPIADATIIAANRFERVRLGPMAPREHIEWFEDNVDWFAGLDLDALQVPVPACPGWNVQYVLNHLAFGLGLAYPAAMEAAPETADGDVFASVRWPDAFPSGPAALDAFAATMASCVDSFRSTDPETPCWTYAGPGTAGFWFRRAAVETTLHRMDVAEALEDDTRPHLDDRRARDAIEETLSFALPLAAELTSPPDGSIRVESSCLAGPLVVGAGDPVAEIVGDPHDVLNLLWGRSAPASISGDRHVADQWLGLIAAAFDGR